MVIKVIHPATEVHIKKYTAQERKMVVETPEKYEKVVLPYIKSFPPSRIEWYVLFLERSLVLVPTLPLLDSTQFIFVLSRLSVEPTVEGWRARN